MVLMNRQELGLTPQQIESLRKLGLDSWRAAIRRNAELRLAQVDLLGLRLSDPVDMGKVETKVREIEKLKGDGSIARVRTAEDARAQLTADQRAKLRSLWVAGRPSRKGPIQVAGQRRRDPLPLYRGCVCPSDSHRPPPCEGTRATRFPVPT
jgi:Spy/CpxP family protein refolding chaperone